MMITRYLSTRRFPHFLFSLNEESHDWDTFCSAMRCATTPHHCTNESRGTKVRTTTRLLAIRECMTLATAKFRINFWQQLLLYTKVRMRAINKYSKHEPLLPFPQDMWESNSLLVAYPLHTKKGIVFPSPFPSFFYLLYLAPFHSPSQNKTCICYAAAAVCLAVHLNLDTRLHRITILGCYSVTSAIAWCQTPSKKRTDRRREYNLVHFSLKMWHLVAIILMNILIRVFIGWPGFWHSDIPT